MAPSPTRHEVRRMSLDSLPNELLVFVLTRLSTRDLLPLSLVSHRFRALISRLLHRRLLASASLEEHNLILECYHPSCKATEPYLVCSYRETDQLDAADEGGVDMLGKLGALYSRFRPHKRDDDRRLRARRRYGQAIPAVNIAGAGILAGAIPQQSTQTSESEEGDTNAQNGDAEDNIEPEHLASHTVMLDSFEPFSQLCVSANLLGREAFTSCVGLADGYVRLWREWLTRQARSPAPMDAEDLEDEELARAGDNTVPLADDPRFLWVDPKKSVGLKVRVLEHRREIDTPILVHRDEALPTIYEIQFEELLIRTSRVLLAVEKAAEEEKEAPRKAVIFGTVRMG